MNCKGRRGSYISVVTALGLVLSIGQLSFAQTRSKSSGDKAAGAGAVEDGPSSVVKIRKLTGVGTESVVKTPEFRASGAHGVKELQEWGEIGVTFDSSPDWIDSLTIRFYVMALQKEGSKKNYSYYQLVVRYRDIEKGKGHMAAAYLVPMGLKRFGPIVAVGVEVLVDDKVVATEENKVKANGLPDLWWTKSGVTEKENVKAREGYLKARIDTPFMLVDFDDYEVSE